MNLTRGALDVHIDQLFQICSDNLQRILVSGKLRQSKARAYLIRVDKNHTVELEREKDVQEQNFIASDDRADQLSAKHFLVFRYSTHPQMVRCFSFCPRSQCGHLYVTSS